LHLLTLNNKQPLVKLTDLEKLKTKGDVIMKKLTSIVGITFLSALLIVPIAVWAHGWGRGSGHMMGYWGGAWLL